MKKTIIGRFNSALFAIRLYSLALFNQIDSALFGKFNQGIRQAGALNPRVFGTPNDVIWGTDNIYGSARVIKASKKKPQDIDWSLDNNGFKTGGISIDDIKVWELECELQASTTLPGPFDPITLAGETGWLAQNEPDATYDRKGRGKFTLIAFQLPS